LYEKPLKSNITYLTQKIRHFKDFFNPWYEKKNKNAYFGQKKEAKMMKKVSFF
jgi:hypothetical protein